MIGMVFFNALYNGETMMKKVKLAMLLFAILATSACAVELPRHDLTGQEVESPLASLGIAPGGGTIAVHNYDWIPYTLEFNPHNFTIRVRAGEIGRHPGAAILPPGARVHVSSPQHIWTMEGNNGRRLDIGVRGGRKVDVDLIPDGANDMVGLEVSVRDHRHGAQELLIAWEHRPPHLMPPPPAPTPYHDPYGGIGGGAQPYHDPYYGGIGSGAQPVPVVGGPSPYYPGTDHPLPVVGVDPPTNPYYQHEEPPHRRRRHDW